MKIDGMNLLDTVHKGMGLYSIKEAASYAKVNAPLLSRWFFGTNARAAVRSATIDKTEGKFLTFDEFVEALAISNLRYNYDVSLQKIREAIDEAKKIYKVDFPFSNKEHKTFIGGNDLLISLKGDQDIWNLTGKNKRQKSFIKCIEPFIDDLEYEDKDAPTAYRAYKYLTDEGKMIFVRMHPKFNFGAPIVGGTGYTAETLYKAAKAEGSEEKAADNYEVNVDFVKAAVRYWQDIKKAA